MEGIICVLIIHRNRLFREGLAFVLAQQQTMTVLGSVAEAGEVLGELERLHPDVIILDLCLPGRDGLGEARQIRGASPEVKILMVGLTELESDVLACIEAGAAGYLPQEASLEDLLNNIQAVAAGEALCSPKVASFLFSRIAEAARERERLRALGLAHLTRREREVIALIEEGLSNKEIAVRLQIEIQTVKNHVHNILDKLQLDGRREAARYARERGLLPISPAQVGGPSLGRF
ncbi:MAG: LuxR C-terminal-related transcriptional regulator [Candidatus Methylomirabilales bacterium]